MGFAEFQHGDIWTWMSQKYLCFYCCTYVFLSMQCSEDDFALARTKNLKRKAIQLSSSSNAELSGFDSSIPAVWRGTRLRGELGCGLGVAQPPPPHPFHSSQCVCKSVCARQEDVWSRLQGPMMRTLLRREPLGRGLLDALGA